MSRLGRKLIKSLRSAVAEDISTWSLYKDKPFFKRLGMVMYTSDLLDPLFKIYYSIDTFIDNVLRLIEFAPLVWRHRNWDYGFVLKFNVKLHELLYKGIFKDGHHIFTKNDTRKLQTVINLYKRIYEDKYDDWQYDYLDKKYGKSEIYFTKIEGTENKPGGPYSTMGSTREDIMTPEQKAAYISERKKMWKLEEYQKKQDLELLGKYIAKYSNKWWD
jgi:hypothetical protein